MLDNKKNTNFEFDNDNKEFVSFLTKSLHESFKKNADSILKMKFNFLNLIEPVIPLLYELSIYIEENNIRDFNKTNINKLNKFVIKTANKQKKCNDSFLSYAYYYQKFIDKYKDLIETFDNNYTLKDILNIENIPGVLVDCVPILLFDSMQDDYKLFTKLVDLILSSYKGSNEYLLFASGISSEYLKLILSHKDTEKVISIASFNAGITYISCTCMGASHLDDNFNLKEILLSSLSERNNTEKSLETLLNNSDIIKKSLDSIPESIKNSVVQVTKDLQTIKFSTMENSYKNSINYLSEKISNQGMQLNEKNNVIKALKLDIEKYEKEIIELKYKISKLEETQTGLAAMTIEEEVPVIVKPTVEEEPLKNQLGYIIKKDEKYYLRTSENKDFLIDCSNHSIFTMNQFALINPKGEIITNYNYLYNTQMSPYGNFEFIVINSREENLVGYSPNKDKYIKLNFNSYKLGINQIVLINSDENKVETVYKRCNFILDNYKDYLDEFIQNIYIIISKFGDSYVVRDIKNNEELIKEYREYKFTEQSIILEYKDGYIKEISNLSFYTNSSLYNKTSIVSAIILDTHIGYKDVDSGKILYINNVPPNKTIYEGDNIKIDEFNNFINVLSTYALFENSSTKKKITVKKEKPKFNKDLINYNVALVGDIGLQNTYKTVGFKNRINIDTYDGSLSYNKIRLNLKDYDLILIDPSSIEHSNMYSIRSNFNDVVFLKNNGASRVVDAILRYFENI